MKRGLSSEPRQFGRVPLIRHLAICVAALAAYLLRDELYADNRVLWVLWLAMFLNLGTTFLAQRSGWTSAARIGSPLAAIVGWTFLIFLTGGVSSPFVAGFGLEIILSGLTCSPMATSLVTVGTIAGLWVQQLWLYPLLQAGSLALQTGFLIATGVLTFYVARRWAGLQERLSRRTADLDQRVQAVEKDLEDARYLCQIGEGAGRLAHGLKNVAHSLHGFTRLIEPRLAGAQRDLEVLGGLREGIGRLEEMTRALLHPVPPGTDPVPRALGSDVHRTIEQIVQEVGRSHPEVRWVRSSGEAACAIELSPSLLREILLPLAQNAVEALGGSGEVCVKVIPEDRFLRIDVSDNGPGLAPEAQARLFRRGTTTKLGGSGLGLFLARRLVETRGGSLTVSEAGRTGGAVFSVRIPAPGHGQEIDPGC